MTRCSAALSPSFSWLSSGFFASPFACGDCLPCRTRTWSPGSSTLRNGAPAFDPTTSPRCQRGSRPANGDDHVKRPFSLAILIGLILTAGCKQPPKPKRFNNMIARANKRLADAAKKFDKAVAPLQKGNAADI